MLVAKTIFLISQIKTEQTITTTSTIIKKSGITNIFAIEKEKTVKTHIGVDKIKTSLGIERKNSIVDVFYFVASITVTAIFVTLPGMAKITIFAVIPVIGIFTILIVALEDMRDWRLTKKLKSLREKRF